MSDLAIGDPVVTPAYFGEQQGIVEYVSPNGGFLVVSFDNDEYRCCFSRGALRKATDALLARK